MPYYNKTYLVYHISVNPQGRAPSVWADWTKEPPGALGGIANAEHSVTNIITTYKHTHTLYGKLRPLAFRVNPYLESITIYINNQNIQPTIMR